MQSDQVWKRVRFETVISHITCIQIRVYSQLYYPLFALQEETHCDGTSLPPGTSARK